MSPVIGFAEQLTDHPDFTTWGVDFQYAWLEGTLEAQLTWLKDAGDWRDVTRWPAGRLFGDTGEYRWQMTFQGLHAVIILEDGIPLPSPFDNGSPLPLAQGDDSPLILWGDWINPNQEKDLESERQLNPRGDPRFWAREIPNIQNYPLDNGDLEKIKKAAGRTQNHPNEKVPTPRLVVRRYRHASQGEFLRCVRLTVASEAEDNKRYKNDQDQSL